MYEIAIIALIVGVFIYRRRIQKDSQTTTSRESSILGKPLVIGGYALAFLPLVVGIISWPFNHDSLAVGSQAIVISFYSVPIGLALASRGVRFINQSMNEDIAISKERKDPRAKINMVFLVAAISNLVSGILLMSGRVFESPEYAAAHSDVSGISVLNLMSALGFFMVLSGLVMTIRALVMKRIPRQNQSFLFVPGTVALTFSLFILVITVVSIQSIAGLN